MVPRGGARPGFPSRPSTISNSISASRVLSVLNVFMSIGCPRTAKLGFCSPWGRCASVEHRSTHPFPHCPPPRLDDALVSLVELHLVTSGEVVVHRLASNLLVLPLLA